MSGAALNFNGIGTAELVTVLIIVVVLVLSRLWPRSERILPRTLVLVVLGLAVWASAMQQWNAGRPLLAATILAVSGIGVCALWFVVNGGLNRWRP